MDRDCGNFICDAPLQGYGIDYTRLDYAEEENLLSMAA